jgi:hypothetical protein
MEYNVQNQHWGWTRFWFTPIDPIGLHSLRVLCGLLFLAWLIPFAANPAGLFGLTGVFDRQAYLDALQTPGTPPAPLWSLVYLCGDNVALVNALWWGAIGVFALFTLGIATRVTSILTWALVASFAANPATQYYADGLLIMLAVYLMVGYALLGQWSGKPTLLERILGSRDTLLSPWAGQLKPGRQSQPSYAANLAVRLLQVHFAVFVVIGCLRNLQFGDWWSGVAYWYPLHDPFTMSAERLRSEAQNAEGILFVLSLAQYAAMGWQLSLPFFAWRPRWRWLLLSGGAVAWIGSLFIWGEPLYGPIYFIGCLSYLTPAEWQSITSRGAALIQGWGGRMKAPHAKKVGVRG